jgi:hypothetical protein
MTIDLNPIPRSDFETEVLKNKDAVRWFIWHARQKIDGIEFNSLQNDNKDVGVCFFIENNESIEVGILIHQNSRSKGFGSNFTHQLITNSTKALIFHVSKYNLSSLLFFQKFVDTGLLVSRVNEKGNSVFETSPSKS